MFEVASSRIRIRGSASSARAIEISWRSPADRPEPPSRTACCEARRRSARGDPVDADARAAARAPRRRWRPAARSGCCRRSCRRTGTGPAARRRAGGGSSQVDARAGRGRRRGRRRRRVVEAGDQLRDRRLAAAGLADQRQAAAGRHVQVDAVQHALGAVGERRRRRGRCGPRCAAPARAPGSGGDVGLGVEDAADLDHRGASPTAPGRTAPRAPAAAGRAAPSRPMNGDQRAERRAAVVQQVGADAQHGDGREHAEELDRREEHRREPSARGCSAVRFSSFSSSNACRNARSRLNAWITAMPASDSARCAVTAAIRLRTSAERDRRAPLEPAREDERRRQHHERHQRRAASRSGTARRSRRRAVSALVTSVGRPSERTSEIASTSLVSRAMIQPARCSEK